MAPGKEGKEDHVENIISTGGGREERDSSLALSQKEMYNMKQRKMNPGNVNRDKNQILLCS